MPETEADTCRIYVLPKLYGAGWTDEQINEQHTFTDGRVIPTAKRIRRGSQKRADYRLRYTRDFPIAIVEAKASYKAAGEGLQQAKEYAEILDLKFAYATNGKEIIEFDFLTGLERRATRSRRRTICGRGCGRGGNWWTTRPPANCSRPATTSPRSNSATIR
jgi:type I restriction enzyme, R subunit